MSKFVAAVYFIGIVTIIGFTASENKQPALDFSSVPMSSGSEQSVISPWPDTTNNALKTDKIIRNVLWGIGISGLLVFASSLVVNNSNIKTKSVSITEAKKTYWNEIFDNGTITNNNSSKQTYSTIDETRNTPNIIIEENVNSKNEITPKQNTNKEISTHLIQSPKINFSTTDLEITNTTFKNLILIAKQIENPLTNSFSNNAKQLLEICAPTTESSRTEKILSIIDPQEKARAVLRSIIEDKIFYILNTNFIENPMDLIIGGLGVHVIGYIDKPIKTMENFYTKFPKKHYISIGENNFKIPQKRISMLSFHNAVKHLGNDFLKIYPMLLFSARSCQKIPRKN